MMTLLKRQYSKNTVAIPFLAKLREYACRAKIWAIALNRERAPAGLTGLLFVANSETQAPMIQQYVLCLT